MQLSKVFVLMTNSVKNGRHTCIKGNKHMASSDKTLKIFSISCFILTYSSLTRVGVRCSPCCLFMSKSYLILPWIEFRKRITPMP